MKKILQSFSDRVFDALDYLAAQRGISVQELIRAVIVPEWLNKQDISLQAKIRDIVEGRGLGEEGEKDETEDS
jgi:hypothetical protein